MTTLQGAGLASVGVDGVACKPAEVDPERATVLDVETAVLDYEGREHLPDAATLARLARDATLRVTTPVRADGFDPLGDDGLLDRIPAAAGRVLVAGHPAYLSGAASERAVAPRLRAAADECTEPWIGTESVERLALAVGGTQFELLSATTARDVRSLRAAGFDDGVAVYAPTVLSDAEDDVLDGVGDYVARRPAVAERLPEGTPTDAAAEGPARAILLDAARDYTLVGGPEEVADRITTLREAGVDRVVAYPARGLDPLID